MPGQWSADFNPIPQTDQIIEAFRLKCSDLFTITHTDSMTRDKGYYGILYAKPSNRVTSLLSLERELLVLITTFENQQVRTIHAAQEAISASSGRVERNTVLILHRDQRGSAKLKAWGRERGLTVLSVFVPNEGLPAGDQFLRLLATEMFSHDPFDITGPVADDANFFGRREEARDLAKKLQSGQIRSCFGMRKIGKTSIIHRIVKEIRQNYDCAVLVVDCQRDAIQSLDAARLLNSLAIGLSTTEASSIGIPILVAVSDPVSLEAASAKLQEVIQESPRPVIVVFDELDYIALASPTMPHWRREFNPFWRNLRAVYQHAKLSGQPFSLFVSGVSSKSFAIESIDGVENAALAFVPEEYLSPIPRGAAMAMIRRLGKLAGLTIADSVAEVIAESCADMPFWIRKACSYIHHVTDLTSRPVDLRADEAQPMVATFIETDGSTMAQVALAHLFRVYPELRRSALACYEGKGHDQSKRILRILEKYGLIRSVSDPSISGRMMAAGIELLVEAEATGGDIVAVLAGEDDTPGARGAYDEWADDLAVFNKKRNILERKMRSICVNFIRMSTLASPQNGSTKARLLRAVDSKRHGGLEHYDAETLISKFFLLDLKSLIKKEWDIFGKIFGDLKQFEFNIDIINDRPDAHANEQIDAADLALHRRSLKWLEERIDRI